MPRKKTEDRYDYILEYLREATESRVSLKHAITRTVRSYQGYPRTNYYLNKLQSYRSHIASNDPDRLGIFDSLCQSIEEERHFVLHDAIETNTSMIMGGPGQFQFEPYDEYNDYDPTLVDQLSAFADFFYRDNKFDSLMGTMGRNLNTQGAAYYYLQYNEKKKKLDATLIDAWRMLLDPFRFKMNRSRYIGFTQTESWSTMKDHIKKEKKGYILRSINQVDTYLSNVVDYINGADRESWEFPTDVLSRHVDMFWPQFKQKAEDNWANKSTSGDELKDTIEGYQADDIEISYLYDLHADKYFIIVNREFIVVARDNDLKKKVKCKGIAKNGKSKDYEREVKLDHPFIEIPYIKASWSTYPITPAFYVLDDFDKIVSMETLMQHNFEVLSPVTFVGSSYDAEKFSSAAGISGELVEGTMEAMGVLAKNHDMSSALASIQRREDKIKKIMKATDQFQVQTMLGNRATAQEVGQAGAAVSQPLNPVLANIETGMSELMQKSIDMYIIHSDLDEFPYSYNGRLHEMSKENLIGRSLIQARLRSVVKLEQQQNSQNALQVLGYVAQAEGVDKEYAYGVLIPIAMQGIVSKQQAQKMVAEQLRLDPKMLKMVSDTMEKRNEEAEQRDEIDDLELPMDIPPEEVEAMLMQAANADIMPPDQGMVDPMMGQPVGDPMGDPSMGMAPGTIPSAAGVIANRPM